MAPEEMRFQVGNNKNSYISLGGNVFTSSHGRSSLARGIRPFSGDYDDGNFVRHKVWRHDCQLPHGNRKNCGRFECRLMSMGSYLGLASVEAIVSTLGSCVAI